MYKHDDKKKNDGKWNQGTGIAMGVAIGTGIGVALNNIGIGIAIGVAIGAGLDAAYARKPSKEECMKNKKYQYIVLGVAFLVALLVLVTVFLAVK